MKYLLTFLCLLSLAYGQTYPLASKDTLVVSTRDSVVSNTVTTSTTFKVPVYTIKKYQEVVTLPPVPPSTYRVLTRLVEWDKPFVFGATYAAKIGDGFTNTQSVNGRIQNGIFPGTNTPAMKMTWLASDPTVSSSYRTEVQSARVPDAKAGEEFYYGFSFYPEQWNPAGGGESIIQWHDLSGTCPPVSIHVYNNELALIVCIKNGILLNKPLGKLIPGQKIDFVLHVKWALDKTGFVEAWRDGLKSVSLTNVQTIDTNGGYLKLGLNRWARAAGDPSRVAYYGPFMAGKTYADVAP